MHKAVLRLIVAVICPATVALADPPTLITYQACLTDANGVNVADGNYLLTFRLHSDPTDPAYFWSETHPAVPVVNGLFQVDLGLIAAFPDTAFIGNQRYLGISVADDPELMPRVLLTASPRAVLASRVIGDVKTTPGMLLLDAPSGDSGVVVVADDMSATSRLSIFDQGTPGWANSQLIRMSTEPSPFHAASIRMFNPQPEPPAHPTLELTTVFNSGASMRMFNPQPEPPAAPVLELSSGVNSGASIRMFNPQPEPPANPVFEVTGGINTGASIKMFNPQPEPPAHPTVELFSGPDVGGSARLRYEAGEDRSDWSASELEFMSETGMTITSKARVSGNGDSYFDGGNVGIGTVTPAFRLEVASAGAGDGMRVNSADGSQLFRVAETSGGSCVAIISNYDGDPGVKLRGSGVSYFTGGNVGIGDSTPANILEVQQGSSTDPIADAWTVYSSRRWKSDIATITGALDKVEQLRGVTYRSKDNNHPGIGLIAEEVGKVIPEVVAYEENGTDAKSIDYARLVAVLIEAVKELRKDNELLKARIGVLERR